MNKVYIGYGLSAILIFCGLSCIFFAFKRKAAKENLEKAFQKPTPKNYGNPFLWMFGLFLIISGLLLLSRL